MKTPVLESLFNKVTDLKACRCFPVNTAKILKTVCFIEHLWWLLLKIVEALKTQNKKNRTAATISTIYMRFLNNLFIFGVLTSVLNFSSKFSKRRIFLVFFKRIILPLGKYISQIIIKTTYILDFISFCMLRTRKY